MTQEIITITVEAGQMTARRKPRKIAQRRPVPVWARAGRLGLQQSAGKRAGPNLPGVRPAVVLHYAACYLGGGHNALFDLGV